MRAAWKRRRVKAVLKAGVRVSVFTSSDGAFSCSPLTSSAAGRRWCRNAGKNGTVVAARCVYMPVEVYDRTPAQHAAAKLRRRRPPPSMP